jgi:hypothetical protein
MIQNVTASWTIDFSALLCQWEDNYSNIDVCTVARKGEDTNLLVQITFGEPKFRTLALPSSLAAVWQASFQIYESLTAVL